MIKRAKVRKILHVCKFFRLLSRLIDGFLCPVLKISRFEPYTMAEITHRPDHNV